MKNNVFYLTNDGLEKMIKEMQKLEKEKEYKLKQEYSLLNRNKKFDPDVVASSEEINFIRRRINEIKNILQNAMLITHRDKSGEVVELGAKVTIEDETGKEMLIFTIVDSPEVDPGHGKISKNSPLGYAALGRKINEKFYVAHPVNKNYFIKKVE